MGVQHQSINQTCLWFVIRYLETATPLYDLSALIRTYVKSLSNHLESLGLFHDTGRAYLQTMRWFLDYVIIWRYMRGTDKTSIDDARGI
jgi:hypothetical protein